MFANDAQQCRAIRALLGSHFHGSRLDELWGPTGPTELACTLLEQGGHGSHGEIVLLRVAFDFWNGRGKAKFSDVIEVLDTERLQLVASLAMAYNGDAVDEWVACVVDGYKPVLRFVHATKGEARFPAPY